MLRLTLNSTKLPQVRKFSNTFNLLKESVGKVKKAPMLSELNPLKAKLKKPNLHSPISELEQEIAKQLKNKQTDATGAALPDFVRQTALGVWFGVIAFMAAGAVLIGGITRLTESGLSMTTWHLIKDIHRPQTPEEWEAEFNKYKASPEYEDVHSDIDLDKFKNIFFWEWFHRNWGRSIGAVYILPYLYFHARGYFKRPGVPKHLAKSSHALLVLLGCQGLYGWYMVKSGLDKDHLESRLDSSIARVSQYRLAGHLSMALLLYSGCFLNMLHCLAPPQGLQLMFDKTHFQDITNAKKLRRMAPGMTLGLVALSIVSGAFVAGLDAGMIYNNWPKMADEGFFHLPRDVFQYEPKWRDCLENPATVQLEHRILTHLTYFSLLSVCLVGYRGRKVLPRSVKYSLAAMFIAANTQVLLGITALLTQCHLHVAASHQSGSVVLLSTCLALKHFLRRIPK